MLNSDVQQPQQLGAALPKALQEDISFDDGSLPTIAPDGAKGRVQRAPRRRPSKGVKARRRCIKEPRGDLATGTIDFRKAGGEQLLNTFEHLVNGQCKVN